MESKTKYFGTFGGAGGCLACQIIITWQQKCEKRLEPNTLGKK
jgi:hypothetical protein